MTNPNTPSNLEKYRQSLREKSIDDYYKNPSICKQCNETIHLKGMSVQGARRKVFCGKKCRDKYYSLFGGKQDKSCKSCGKLINKGSIGFCSRACEKSHKKKETIDGYIKKMESGEDVFQYAVRKAILATRDHVCEKCGNKEWNGLEIPLVVDHIDGNPYNNKLINLRLLCPNCDAQTDTYKGKNRGNGRFQRMERYNEGKSF